MNTLNEIQEMVNQFAEIAGLESIKVIDMRQDEEHQRPAELKADRASPPRYHFRVSRELYNLGQITQRECLIELVAEALYFHENPYQYHEVRTQRLRQNDPNLTTTRLDELEQELRSKINRPSDPEV